MKQFIKDINDFEIYVKRNLLILNHFPSQSILVSINLGMSILDGTISRLYASSTDVKCVIWFIILRFIIYSMTDRTKQIKTKNNEVTQLVHGACRSRQPFEKCVTPSMFCILFNPFQNIVYFFHVVMNKVFWPLSLTISKILIKYWCCSSCLTKVKFIQMVTGNSPESVCS